MIISNCHLIKKVPLKSELRNEINLSLWNVLPDFFYGIRKGSKVTNSNDFYFLLESREALAENNCDMEGVEAKPRRATKEYLFSMWWDWFNSRLKNIQDFYF